MHLVHSQLAHRIIHRRIPISTSVTDGLISSNSPSPPIRSLSCLFSPFLFALLPPSCSVLTSWIQPVSPFPRFPVPARLSLHLPSHKILSLTTVHTKSLFVRILVAPTDTHSQAPPSTTTSPGKSVSRNSILLVWPSLGSLGHTPPGPPSSLSGHQVTTPRRPSTLELLPTDTSCGYGYCLRILYVQVGR
ncbi:hypothetical protein LX36DRAFT_19284 [Colletotrichum falcatum]|nr:hypothetical protein LX36DRAFT_19284 [Colletotrichum falcatum]